MAGRPKKFKDGKRLIELFRSFCEDIVMNDYDRIPSQTNFCKWLSVNYDGCDRKTIYSSLNQYFPTIKKDFEQIQSDTVAEGAMLGKYQPTMSIFVLKNWCRWGDRAEVTAELSDNGLLTELIEGLKE